MLLESIDHGYMILIPLNDCFAGFTLMVHFDKLNN